MSEEKKELIEDVCGDFGFRVRYSYSEHWCDVEAWAIVCRTMDGVPEFQRKDARVGPDPVPETKDAERYLNGFIKWDGCSEFHFAPDEDMGVSYGHFHWCGPEDYRKHFALLEALYRRAQQLMTKGNWDPWDAVTG